MSLMGTVVTLLSVLTSCKKVEWRERFQDLGKEIAPHWASQQLVEETQGKVCFSLRGLTFWVPSCLAPGEGSGTPLQYSCLENPVGGGAWWTVVHGVTKSQTRLKRLSSSSSMSGSNLAPLPPGPDPG